MSGPSADSARYRCGHQREQLELRGVTVDIGYYGEFDLTAALDRYACFVLYRLPWDRGVGRFLERARSRGRAVLADVDDLVFDPERAHLVQAVVTRSEKERRRYEDGIQLLRRTLSEVDGVLVSTDPLRDAVVGINHAVAVIPNTVSAEMVARAEAATADAHPPRDEVTLAYLSGTPTHDLDFGEAAEAVLWALERYPQARFLAAGFLTLDPRFDRFAGRVERAPYRPWRELPSLLARVDVNLAPLERENAFTEAKSCVKFLEAALLGVPTVASATPDFVRAIDPGRNGLLARSLDEWREALTALIESRELRLRLGAEARRDVLAHHTTEARAAETLAVLASLGRTAPADAPLTINWLVPPGGGRESERLPGLLGERGHTVRLCGAAGSRLGELASADVTIATDAATAQIAAGFQRTLVRAHIGPSAAQGLLRVELPDDDVRAADELERVLLETAFARLERPAPRSGQARRRAERPGQAG